VLAFQEHGAVGPEGRRVLFSVGRHAALRNNVECIQLEAKRLQQHLLRVINCAFFEGIAVAHRFILILAN